MGKAIYTILGEEQLREIAEMCAYSAVNAYRKEHVSATQKEKNHLLYKTRILLEKYRYLKKYADNAVYTLEQVEEIERGSSMREFRELMGIGISKSDSEAYNLKRGIVIVKILITHIDRML